MKFYLIVNLDGETEYASLSREARDAIWENDYSKRHCNDYYMPVDFDPSSWIIMP